MGQLYIDNNKGQSGDPYKDVTLVYKTKDGETLASLYGNMDCEEGNIFYLGKKVGSFISEHDSHLGTYRLLNVKGKEFHDHYFDSDDIIRICKLK